jgi:phosphoribosyl-ATP pyrophosphohydrolase/phosphoribosyl-AMP cyclohydrolase
MDVMDRVRWDALGVVPVVVQDAGTGTILAFDAMDRPALLETIRSGFAVFWHPDEAPPGPVGRCAADGPRQMVIGARLACDGRAVLLRVQPAGPVCRQGPASCFSEDLVALLTARAVRGPIGQDERQWPPEAAEDA